MPSSRLNLIAIFTCLVLSAGGILPCCAQEPRPQPTVADLERRVRDLEAVIQKIKSEQGKVQPSDVQQPPLPPLDPASNNSPVSPTSSGISENAVVKAETEGREPRPFAGWRDGFIMESGDKAFIFRVTGQIQGDYRDFLNDKDQTDIETFLVRRARFGLEATMFNYYEFRLLPDFGQGTAVVQDAYMNVHYWDELQVEIGKFKQPFSYEQLIQDRYVPTMERSLIDQIVPARDVGVMIHGQKLFDDRFDYALAVSDGQINGNIDNNAHKDFNGRVAVRPMNSDCFSPWFSGLQVGISGGIGIEQEAISPAILRTPATVPWFQYSATVRADGVRSRLSPELAYFNGPFGFASQYMLMEQEVRPSATLPGYPFRQTVPTEGYYFMATCLLTGEERTTYSAAIDPLRPFNPCCPFVCPGAWEIVVRASHLRVGDGVFAADAARLADPAKVSDRATEMTVGFNWYLNKWFRVQFNYEHAWFAEPVQLGASAGNLTKYQDSLLTRFQIIF